MIKKPFVKFCFKNKKEKAFCIEWLLEIKNGFIMRIPNVNKLG